MDEEALIRAATMTFSQAFNSGNAEAALCAYGEDLVKIREGAPIETKPDVVARLRDTLSRYQGLLAATVDEVLIFGNHAFTRGSYSLTLTPRGGGATLHVARRSVELWRKEGGRWKVIRMIDNTGASGP